MLQTTLNFIWSNAPLVSIRLVSVLNKTRVLQFRISWLYLIEALNWFMVKMYLLTHHQWTTCLKMVLLSCSLEKLILHRLIVLICLKRSILQQITILLARSLVPDRFLNMHCLRGIVVSK